MNWLRFAKGTLEQAGYEVVAASDFDEAANSWLDESFDLIVISLDQAESHRSMLSDLAKNPTDPKRVLVMFPIRQSYDRMRFVFKAGAFDIVDKPYKADVLLSMVARQITEARQESSQGDSR